MRLISIQKDRRSPTTVPFVPRGKDDALGVRFEHYPTILVVLQNHRPVFDDDAIALRISDPTGWLLPGS